ncbi:hypothetical protein C4D60_Mb01t04360 [Musa balbisiana]|uniref:Uncharacterized protein n=1 Tax=Musa balbisiana TaxID=52838 RepID=A0A4S8JLT0_MUSBA|nr:hypothetical protein C4D60_Mb01t04360 [Musa balbisiana]
MFLSSPLPAAPAYISIIVIVVDVLLIPRPLYTIDRHVVLCVVWQADYEMESADGYLLLYLRVVILITRTAPTPLVLTS